ncbi:MAG: hypothetical protein HRU75_04900 [Planctomycetia bacterium]|nr:MAG: hypothetical protein HRU75_04900 [Planctomycetia bacterium]
MSKTIAFVQVHGQTGILETEIPETPTVAELQDALKALGISVDAETLIFIDEAEDHIPQDRAERVRTLKRGCRLHVSRCRRIKTTVNFMQKTAEREFPPGARVKTVKEWAVRKFEMDPKDAAEHVLQLCGSTERPASDTPLVQLVRGHHCAVCFDLVPEKRVEG